MDYDIQRNLEENGQKSKTIRRNGRPIKLSVEHILGALYVLLFGNVVAVVCFSVEMLVNYFSCATFAMINVRKKTGRGN